MKLPSSRTSIEVVCRAVLIIGVITAWCTVSEAGFSEGKDRLSMEVSILQHQDASYNLRVVLRNNTTTAFESDKAQLPWSAYLWSKWIKASGPKKRGRESVFATTQRTDCVVVLVLNLFFFAACGFSAPSSRL